MDLRNLTPKERTSAAFNYFSGRIAGYPALVNLEVTQRCNARCDFCRYWHTKAEDRLDDYVPVLRKLRPSAVIFTGGEPLLRLDLERLVGDARAAFPWMFMGTVTNGALLTVERGMKLWNAGLNQIMVSLDFPDERHDTARGIPGLTERIKRTVPQLIAAGISNVVIQTVIKSDNIDCVLDVVAWATSVGARVSVSSYTSTKSGNEAHHLEPSQLGKLKRLVDEMVRRKQTGAPISTSTYFMERIPEYCENGGIGGCVSGSKFVRVTPSGYVNRCSEFSDGCHYTEWNPGTFGATDCGACWVPCRGESQAPLTLDHIRQVATLYYRRA
jgi:MoaA/NifB/PqqE/SkfB family radical SAM enzyme